MSRDDAGVLAARSTRLSRRTLLWVLVRSGATGLGLFVAYWFLPLDAIDSLPLLYFIGGTALFALSVVWQLRIIAVSPIPVLRAVEAIALLLPLAILVSAGAYVVMSAVNPGAFNEPLDKIDAVYFSATVLTTVGFGDIVPVASSARIAVAIQMLLNLVIVAVVVRAITAATNHSKASRAPGAERSAAPPGDD